MNTRPSVFEMGTSLELPRFYKQGFLACDEVYK
jgi:hypothetical protein